MEKERMKQFEKRLRDSAVATAAAFSLILVSNMNFWQEFGIHPAQALAGPEFPLMIAELLLWVWLVIHRFRDFLVVRRQREENTGPDGRYMYGAACSQTAEQGRKRSYESWLFGVLLLLFAVCLFRSCGRGGPIEQQLEMIRKILPDATKIGIMYTTSEVNSASTLAEYKEKAPDYGFEIIEAGVSSTADIPLAADSILEQVDCLNNLTDNTVVSSLPLILSKANAKNIPVFGSEIEQVKVGCLAAMGLDYVDLGKQTGHMAAKVLKGEAKASEINFEVIEEAAFYGNEKVAENLDLEFPAELADTAKEIFTEITE